MKIQEEKERQRLEKLKQENTWNEEEQMLSEIRTEKRKPL
jgi:hypothetical protein